MSRLGLGTHQSLVLSPLASHQPLHQLLPQGWGLGVGGEASLINVVWFGFEKESQVARAALRFAT